MRSRCPCRWRGSSGSSATRYLDGPRPRLFAHRGASGTAPENTIEAFAAALDAGADRLELDVHATSDGEIVVLHDAELDRTTDGSGPVCAVSLTALSRLDAGHRFTSEAGAHPWRGRGVRVPTLARVLETFPDVPLNIEVKQADPAIETSVLGALNRFGARSRTLLAAEDGTIMSRIRAAAPDVVTSASAPEVAEFVARIHEDRLDDYDPVPVALQVPPTYGDVEIVSARSVEIAHALGLEVHVWTINDEAEMERLLDLGVDGLMTDFPARAAAVLRRRRQR